MSFRDTVEYVFVHWLRRGDGEKLTEAICVVLDMSVRRVLSGLLQRFPSYAGDEAIQRIGRDRWIPRGRAETREHYAGRLVKWRHPYGHKTRGNGPGLLEQWREYFGNLGATGCVVATGKWMTLDVDGTYTKSTRSWTWDSEPSSEWSRFWGWIDGSQLFIEQLSPGDPDFYGGAVGTSGYCIGMRGASADDWDAIRWMLYSEHPWRNAGSLPMWMIVSFDGTWPTPDATWELWGKVSGTSLVPARSSSYRYVALGETVCQYAGDPTVWTNEAVTDNLGTFTGDPTNFPATITMPDGTSYAGDPTNFPATITMPHDGSRL